jgi:glycine cleavage system H protein
MQTPEELRYSKDHEWVRHEGAYVRVGITDFAQDALGDVVYVDLPQVGTIIVSDLAFAEVESTKSVSDIFAPLAGEIVEVNQVLEDEPELVNEDPYGDGWVCVIKPNDIDHLELLMDAERYLAFVSQEPEA